MTLPPPQITAHVLQQAVLPAAQKTEELVGGVHPSGTVELLRVASGEGPKDAQMEGSAQLSCSVKEEPDGYVQETGEVRVHQGWGPLRVRGGSPGEAVWRLGAPGAGLASPAGRQAPRGLGSLEAGGKGWLPACCVPDTQRARLPAARGGPRLQHQCQLLACPGSQEQPLTPACLAS